MGEYQIQIAIQTGKMKLDVCQPANIMTFRLSLAHVTFDPDHILGYLSFVQVIFKGRCRI